MALICDRRERRDKGLPGLRRAREVPIRMQEETQTVDLPERIIERVEARLPRTEWDTSAEYITYVLEEVLYHVEKETEDDDFEPIDEDEVKERLRSLGYLNE